MSTTTAPDTQPAGEPVEVVEGAEHAEHCDLSCSFWVGTDTPTCQPFPCRCRWYKENSPEWGRERCWYRKKVGGVAVGGLTSKCPCWGSDRTGKPGDCCSHHSANPRYLWVPAAAAPSLGGDEEEDPAGSDRAADPEEAADRPDLDDLDWSYLDLPFADPERQFKPFVRRWTPQEITCDCATPWDPLPGSTKKVDVRTLGVHCTDCHQNFRSPSLANTHRPVWTAPCRHPSTMLDVDTGQPVMELHGDVWHGRETSTYRPAGWTPGRFHRPARTAEHAA